LGLNDGGAIVTIEQHRWLGVLARRLSPSRRRRL
jgi:hypothetical protein